MKTAPFLLQQRLWQPTPGRHRQDNPGLEGHRKQEKGSRRLIGCSGLRRAYRVTRPISLNDYHLSSGTRQGRIERERALGFIMAQSGVQRQLRRPPPTGAAPSWRHS